MPYADYEKKLGHMKLWRRRKMSEGYGKWLYARRKLKFVDADEFRDTLATILDIGKSEMSLDAKVGGMLFQAESALQRSRQREDELGAFEPASLVSLPSKPEEAA
jgi:hypothetical protein